MSDGYRAASFVWMLKEAENFAFHLAAANRPTKCYGPGVLPPTSTSCVETRWDGSIAFNYASRGVQAMIAGELHTLEGLVDEGYRRMSLAEEYALAGYQAFTDLDHEMRLFLDGLNITAPWDELEIRDFALEMAQSLFKGPTPAP